MRIYVIRHGQTLWNIEDRFQGQSDSPLSAAGREHAVRNGVLLREVPVTRLIASPLGRARDTARIVAGYLGVSVDLDDRLMERDYGEWTGSSATEIARRWPAHWAARLEDEIHHRPPGGENVPDMIARVRPLLSDLLAGDARDTLALVTHGGLIRAILTHLLALTPGESLDTFIPNDAVHRLDVDGEACEVAHFRNGEGPVRGRLTRGRS